jgi:hypothetical protein
VENYGYKRVAFADKIRDLLLEMDPPVPMGYGLEAHVVGLRNYVEVYGWDKAKQNKIVRAMLQNLGVGARTVFGENHWIVEAMKDIELFGNYVITDVRFTNEANWIKDIYDGQLWRIKRTGVEPVNNHVSEHEMDGYPVDMILKNEGTLEDLRTLVRKRMEFALDVN